MSANPQPSLFDEDLARRLDTLLTAVGALLLMGIELAALADGAYVRALVVVEVFSLSLLAFAGLLRFARSPWLAVLSAALALVLALRVSWFRDDLPGELFSLALGLLTALFLLRSRLPGLVMAALIPTALSLAMLMSFEPGPAAAPVLYAFIAVSARSRPLPGPPGLARWRGGNRWWSVCVAAMLLFLVPGIYTQLREPLELWSRELFQAAVLVGLVTSLVWLLAWTMLLRGMESLGSSSFWSAIRLGVWTQCVLLVLLIGAQLYGLAEGHEHWPPYVAAGHSFAFMVFIRTTPLAVFLLLRGSRSRLHRRLFWPWFMLAADGLGLAFYTADLVFTLDRMEAAVATLHGLLFVVGLVAMWGLMRALRDELSDTSMADTFSSDPETPETPEPRLA